MRRKLRRPTAGASRGPSRPSISGSSPASVRASSCSRRIDSCTAAMCVDQRRSESGSRASAFSVASSAAGASEGSLTRLGSGDDVRGNQDETVASLLGGSVAGAASAAPFGRAASARFFAGMAPHGGGTEARNCELIPFLTHPALALLPCAISASLPWRLESLATFRRPGAAPHHLAGASRVSGTLPDLVLSLVDLLTLQKAVHYLSPSRTATSIFRSVPAACAPGLGPIWAWRGTGRGRGGDEAGVVGATLGLSSP